MAAISSATVFTCGGNDIRMESGYDWPADFACDVVHVASRHLEGHPGFDLPMDIRLVHDVRSIRPGHGADSIKVHVCDYADGLFLIEDTIQVHGWTGTEVSN
ncbi:MAG: hypothetical protein MPK62_00870 [Alphaproteobacteria bacterium]|nr:hypothetical protein [Alphaproteobacteria bacterium]MDA8029686.1 hypothetical protein [Alphaproteobacteria bacterium]